MFGYVIVNKPELKIREFDEYREYYCGICQGLRRNHGLKSQMALSYDYAFLYILLSALYEPKEERKQVRCPIHPVKGVYTRDNKFADYISDMGIILSKLKCDDDWADEKKITRKIYGNAIKSDYYRIKEKYPDKTEVIEQSILNISGCQNRDNIDIDVLSGFFGNAFGEVFTPYEDEWEQSLRKIGFYLGKYIYIIDAYDDIEKDIKDKTFNPFISRYKEPGFSDYVKQILTVNAAECAREFEKLPIINEVGILRNIIYSGIWTRFNIANARRNKDEESI